MDTNEIQPLDLEKVLEGSYKKVLTDTCMSGSLR